MPSRVLDWKSPIEMLKGNKGDLLPLRNFGCVCFVQDNRPNVEKLDSRAVKCIFVGYSATQNGYVCWSPVEKRLSVSMDVTFREFEPYYSSSVPLSLGDSLDTGGMRQAGENSGSESDGERRSVSVGDIPCPFEISAVVEPEHEESAGVEPEVERNELEGGRTLPQGELRYREVYMRRNKQIEGAISTVPPVPNPLSLPSPTLETPTPSPTDSEYAGDMIHLSTPPSPLTIRRTTRSNAGVPPDRYGFPHDIVQFVSYSHISSVHGAFIASLDTVSIPKCWQVAKDDPQWKTAMLEELGALDENNTWELVSLPPGKKAVGCKWVFIVKHNSEGLIERYKARLVGKGYSQTYGIDYDETFALVVKMNTVRTLVFLTANGGWKLHQLDVKNAFLHGDLLEEVYMKVPPGFGTKQTSGKVCRLKKSLYELKQSP